MAYDEKLAEQVRTALMPQDGIEEKKMFGGVGVLINGNMICGLLREDLIVWIGLDHYDQVLTQKGVRQFDITGRVMKGWIMVSPAGFEGKKLGYWVNMGLNEICLVTSSKELKLMARI
jgi:hypothetical protein